MYNYLGDFIKKLRKQRNLTQEQIADAFGVSCQAISKWETGNVTKLIYRNFVTLPSSSFILNQLRKGSG